MPPYGALSSQRTMLESAAVFPLITGPYMKKFVVSSSVILMAGFAGQPVKGNVAHPGGTQSCASYQSHSISRRARSPIAVGKFDKPFRLHAWHLLRQRGPAGQNPGENRADYPPSQTGRFSVLDRDNMAGVSRPAGIKQQLNLKAPTTWVTGDVTEFGRKEVRHQ